MSTPGAASAGTSSRLRAGPDDATAGRARTRPSAPLPPTATGTGRRPSARRPGRSGASSPCSVLGSPIGLFMWKMADPFSPSVGALLMLGPVIGFCVVLIHRAARPAVRHPQRHVPRAGHPPDQHLLPLPAPGHPRRRTTSRACARRALPRALDFLAAPRQVPAPAAVRPPLGLVHLSAFRRPDVCCPSSSGCCSRSPAPGCCTAPLRSACPTANGTGTRCCSSSVVAVVLAGSSIGKELSDAPGHRAVVTARRSPSSARCAWATRSSSAGWWSAVWSGPTSG